MEDEFEFPPNPSATLEIEPLPPGYPALARLPPQAIDNIPDDVFVRVFGDLSATSWLIDA